jgi:hypothetical protein
VPTRRMRTSRTFAIAGLSLVLSLAGLAGAETAADKATAREAATQGIELFRAGKYEAALDKLRRAQALYDAPVHLLYIARAEEKLGQLVEASESYRLLDRYTLPSGAPEAWVAAVQDGRKELDAIEPRIPKLSVLSDPKDVPSATLEIDGAAVSSAVIGIARPVNPGKHHVALSAPGYFPATADVELKEAQSREVTLRLAPGGPAAAAVAPAGSATQGDSNPAAAPPAKESFVGFLGGIRLGAAIPTGKLFHTTALGGRDINTTDAFQAGGSFELHAGIRLGRYFTPVLYLEGDGLSAGDGLLGQSLKNTTSGSVGIGLIVATPPGKMGGFGELDLLPVNAYSASFSGGSCSVTASGSALRLAGGGVFPVLDWLQLSPFAAATIGSFSKLTTKSCAGFDSSGIETNGTIDSGNTRTHATIVLGVGGDVVLGGMH